MLQAFTQWAWVHIRGVTLALTVTISLFLLVRTPQTHLTPVRWGVIHLIAAGQRLFQLPIRLASRGDENRYLRGRLLERVFHETELRELRLENARLRNMLRFKRKSRLELLAARVLSHDAEIPPTTITIDVGSDDGVLANQAVVSPEGLVGRIDAEPSAHSALVRLITDPGLRVSAVVENPERVTGIVRWDATRMVLDNVAEEALLSEGDRVVSSGLGGIFPRGLFVGTVEKVIDDPHALFKTVILKPGVRTERLEEVFILRTVASSPKKAEVSDAVGR